MSRKMARIINEDGCSIRIVHQDRVDQARNDAIGSREMDTLSRLFKALGDPTRLSIAMALLRGEMCVCDLAAFTRISESAVSHQLRHMKDLALLKNRRDGQTLYYSLDDEHVGDLIRIGLEHIRE